MSKTMMKDARVKMAMRLSLAPRGICRGGSIARGRAMTIFFWGFWVRLRVECICSREEGGERREG